MIWNLIARFLARPRVTAWLIQRATHTPYTHITGADGSLYMQRFWLFNPYGKDDHGDVTPARWRWLPSIRLHRIMRPDADRHLHSHPWDARTIILRGSYEEVRAADGPLPLGAVGTVHWRHQGTTATLKPTDFHRITYVHPPLLGCWTMFITWRKVASWYFLVDGKEVPWRDYLGCKPDGAA